MRNDAKYNALKNYSGDKTTEAAKRDEEIMLKAMAARDERESKEIQRKRDFELKNKTDASSALMAQMQEKQQKKDLLRENDAMYANQIAQRI